MTNPRREWLQEVQMIDDGFEDNAASFIEPDPVEPPEAPDYDQPSDGYAEQRKRKPKALAYQKKAHAPLRELVRIMVQREALIPDAATILMHGPALEEAAGDWAAENDQVARAIDWFNSGAEMPSLAFAAAALSIGIQVVRNHEPVLEPAPRGIKIPFRKEPIKIKLGIRLGGLRALGNDPDALSRHVFTDRMIAAFEKQGIHVAAPWRKGR